jgi:hypothetical protein
MGAAVWLHILKFKAQNFFKINVVGETSTIFLSIPNNKGRKVSVVGLVDSSVSFVSVNLLRPSSFVSYVADFFLTKSLDRWESNPDQTSLTSLFCTHHVSIYTGQAVPDRRRSKITSEKHALASRSSPLAD